MAICSCLLPYQTLALAVSAFRLGSASTSLAVSALQPLPIFPLPHPYFTSSLKQIIFNITPLVQHQSSAPVSTTTVEVIFTLHFSGRSHGFVFSPLFAERRSCLASLGGRASSPGLEPTRLTAAALHCCCCGGRRSSTRPHSRERRKLQQQQVSRSFPPPPRRRSFSRAVSFAVSTATSFGGSLP